MWFDQKKIDALEGALKTGQRGGLEPILQELLAVDKSPMVPTFCPRCGKTFIRRQLPYLRMVVQSCPDHHGVWLNEDSARKIKRFFEYTLPTAGRTIKDKQKSFRVFAVLVGIGVSILNYYQDHPKIFNQNYKMQLSMHHTQKVGPRYWPTRDFSNWNAFPINQNVITDPTELAYIQEWVEIANDGIVNRLNIHDALLVKRPGAEYLEAYAYFVERQSTMIARLQELAVPPRLNAFHTIVVEAMATQLSFYDDYARRKADNPSLEWASFLQNPILLKCNDQLWDAYHEFERIYPKRDTATNDAIANRLGWLDMV